MPDIVLTISGFCVTLKLPFSGGRKERKVNMEKFRFVDESEICEDEVMETGSEYAAKQKKDKDDFSYEIVDSIGVLRTLSNGFSKELNIVIWNGRKPKYDIRDWNSDHSRMTRGVTLTPDEMDTICKLMAESGRKAFARVLEERGTQPAF